jgi:hypothetical protein
MRDCGKEGMKPIAASWLVATAKLRFSRTAAARDLETNIFRRVSDRVELATYLSGCTPGGQTITS